MIDDATTKKVADLIKLNIPASELPHYTKQLSSVLKSVEILKEVPTENVSLTAQTHGLVNILREDEPAKGLDISLYPNKRNLSNGYFFVEKVL